jgi:putative ABC transport system permease protein
MIWLGEILAQAARNLWDHKLRATLTMFGIAWGLAAIIFTMAIGDGFKQGYQNALYALGTDVVILWGGRTAGQAGDQRAGREVRLTLGDVEAIRRECDLIRDATPELSRYLAVRSPHNSGRFSTHGVAPVYQTIRSMRLAEGRHFTTEDQAERRRVCLIGYRVRKQLFADRPTVGASVLIEGLPFTVVGELTEKDQNNSYNGLDEEKVIVPYSTMAQHFPNPRPFVGRGTLDNIIFTPSAADDHEAAVQQVRTLLGRRHRFAPDDEGALYIWDTVETARMVNRIYDAMQAFLVVVAIITLGLGGVGVMNIMLVSVAERTREIGIKQSLGATPTRILAEFFLESLALTLMSGLVGVVFAGVVTSLVNRLPLPTMFAGLPVHPMTAGLAFAALALVGILAALVPARRASRLPPVEALRYE